MPIEQVIGIINGIVLVVMGYVAKMLTEMRTSLVEIQREQAAAAAWRVEFTKTTERHFIQDASEFADIWRAIDYLRGNDMRRPPTT